MTDPADTQAELRERIGAKVRELRSERRVTQRQLAELLGHSQGHISNIERGQRSLSAEEFLMLLAHFNVGLDGFTPSSDHLGSLQNALTRFGAYHLREDPRVHVATAHATPRDAVREVLLHPKSERLVTSLAPVVVVSINDLPLAPLQHNLAAAGVPHRLPWLIENVLAAIGGLHSLPQHDWALRVNRASVVLSAFKIRPPGESDQHPPDAFDLGVRTQRSNDLLWEQASHISRKWQIASRLQPHDFRQALEQAIESR